MNAGTCKGQKRRASDDLMLELQAAVSLLTCVLGTKLRSSTEPSLHFFWIFFLKQQLRPSRLAAFQSCGYQLLLIY